MNQSASEITVTPARDYGNEVGQGWPGVVAPAPGELLSSWLHRLAMANGIPPQYFGRVLDVAVGDWSAKLDRDLPGRILSLLVERTRLPAEEIDGLALHRDPLARLRVRQITGSGDARTSTARVNCHCTLINQNLRIQGHFGHFCTLNSSISTGPVLQDLTASEHLQIASARARSA